MTRQLNVRYVIFVAVTAALGGLLFGFDVGIITGAGPFIAKQFDLSDLSLGGAYSALIFGCVVGSLVAGKLSDRLGRRRLLIVVALLFGLSSVAVACSDNLTPFMAARFLGGIAVGGISVLSPLYIAEVAPPSMRGRLGALYQMMIVVGILVSYGINFLLLNAGSNNWRWMFLTGVIPSVVFLLMMMKAPETPRFLEIVGDSEEAFRVLARINGSEQASVEIAEIKATMQEERRHWGAMLRPGVRRALIASSCVAILVQISGINTIIDYAPAIFESAGWSSHSAFTSLLLIGLIQLVFTVLSLWMIDKFGRKPLYIVGSLGMTFSVAALALTVVLGGFHGVLVLALILACLAFFATCIGPVFWTLMPEIFPNDVRGAAMTVPVLLQWLANAAVILLFPLIFHRVGKTFTFSFFALAALAQGAFTWLCVPETKNRSLEEIESYWTGMSAQQVRDVGFYQESVESQDIES
ncbi:MAG: sugar porter family MFS transporter [Acidobacteriaceae bacterium]